MDTIDIVYQELEKRFHTFQTPVVELIEAQTKDPFKILITTLLSARTKDQTTSAVVTRLFQQIDTYGDLKKYSLEELEKMIYPVGFYRNKAKYLQKMPYVLEEKFNGIVPETIDQLCELPGVGRKTANLVRAIAFKKPAICVDIHVHRICNRWDFVNTSTPEETYFELKKKLPKEYWRKINDLLVIFGKNICKPLNPNCDGCKFKSFCPYFLKWSYFYDILNKYGFTEGIKESKGTYILHLYLRENKNILIGKRKIFFRKGHYFYVGSAYGKTINLKTRIERHLRKDKNKHWHIDYFLEFANVRKVYTTSLKCEKEVCKDLNFLDFIEGFGNSDDNENDSHLFYIKP